MFFAGFGRGMIPALGNPDSNSDNSAQRRVNCAGLRASVSCCWAVSPAFAKLCVQRRVALGPCQTVLVQSSSNHGMVLMEQVGCECSHLPHCLWAGPVPIRAPLVMHTAWNCLCMKFPANLMFLVYFISLNHCYDWFYQVPFASLIKYHYHLWKKARCLADETVQESAGDSAADGLRCNQFMITMLSKGTAVTISLLGFGYHIWWHLFKSLSPPHLAVNLSCSKTECCLV